MRGDSIKGILKEVESARFAAVGGQKEPRILPPQLALQYAGYNGGYYWGRALLMRPLRAGPSGVLTIGEWNEVGLWKGAYGPAIGDITFFAEDAFGTQVGITTEGVVQFDPETARSTRLAASVVDWARLVVSDAAYHTGYPVLEAWERANRPLADGERLLPRQPFVCGGEFHSNNMVVVRDVDGMQTRTELWELTRDLPEGARVTFREGE